MLDPDFIIVGYRDLVANKSVLAASNKVTKVDIEVNLKDRFRLDGVGTHWPSDQFSRVELKASLLGYRMTWADTYAAAWEALINMADPDDPEKRDTAWHSDPRGLPPMPPALGPGT